MGNTRIGTMLAMAMVASMPTVAHGAQRRVDWWGDANEPVKTGRRAEKDAEAVRKAAAKRERKALKRATGGQHGF